MKGMDVRLDKTPKVLGVTFDTMHFFPHHIDITKKKANKKALA